MSDTQISKDLLFVTRDSKCENIMADQMFMKGIDGSIDEILDFYTEEGVDGDLIYDFAALGDKLAIAAFDYVRSVVKEKVTQRSQSGGGRRRRR